MLYVSTILFYHPKKDRFLMRNGIFVSSTITNSKEANGLLFLLFVIVSSIKTSNIFKRSSGAEKCKIHWKLGGQYKS